MDQTKLNPQEPLGNEQVDTVIDKVIEMEGTPADETAATAEAPIEDAGRAEPEAGTQTEGAVEASIAPGPAAETPCDVDAAAEAAGEPAAGGTDAEPQDEPAPEQGPAPDPAPAAIPGFLTRDQYGRMGDDPAPLSPRFEVIDGTGPLASTPEPEPRSASETAPEPIAPAACEPEAQDGPSALASVGTLLSQGATAMRQVGAAKKAHDAARAELSRLERQAAEREEELERRRDIDSRHGGIVAEQTARRDAAQAAANAAGERARELAAAAAELKGELAAMKEDDAQVEKRLKAAVDAAEAKEASGRESGARLQRRLDDAERALKAAEEERETGVEAAQRTVDSARARLDTLREEFAEISRNPSANTAAYSVRSTEIQNEISDAMEALRRAQDDLPRITRETEAAVERARALAAEARKPIDDAKSAFRAVTGEADTARDELDRARREAAERQRALRDRAAEQERAAREQQAAQEAARDEAADAQGLIDEAEDIHAHPEVTDQLAELLAQDRALMDEKRAQVESLAAVEQDIRESTRDSRLKFTGLLAGCAAVAVVILLLVFLL